MHPDGIKTPARSELAVRFVPGSNMGAAGIWIVLSLWAFILNTDFVSAWSLPTTPRASSPQQNQQLLIVGYGRVGHEVAQWALNPALVPTSNIASDGWIRRVYGTVRRGKWQSNERDAEIHQTNAKVQHIPFGREMFTAVVPSCRYILITMPPPPSPPPPQGKIDDNGVALYDMLWDTLVKHLTDDCWVGIISTAGVYHTTSPGAWVTEEDLDHVTQEDTTTTNHIDHMMHSYLAWEKAWCDQVVPPATTTSTSTCHRRVVRIFRCAGIYSSDRSALHTAYINSYTNNNFKATEASSSESRFMDITNRIHVTDIARAIVASMQLHEMNQSLKTDPVRIYNLSDDQPESRTIVMRYATQLLHSFRQQQQTESRCSKQQPFGISTKETVLAKSVVTSTSGRRARRRLENPKRVSNQRMKCELISELMYPTYQEGLQAILQVCSNPWWQNAVPDE